MIVDEDSGRRFEVAIELLEEGERIVFCGVGIIQNVSSSTVEIESYSEWDFDRITPRTAQEGIAKSKNMLLHLMSISDRAKEALRGKDFIYVHCYDYGKGAVAVAEEKEGIFRWLKK